MAHLGADHLGSSFHAVLTVKSRSLLYTWTRSPAQKVTSPGALVHTLWLNAIFCWLECEGSATASDSGVSLVLMTRPGSNSLAEYPRFGSIMLLMICMASYRCSGQFLSSSAPSMLSSPRSGVHSHFSMLSSFLFIPSTRPFTQGKYTGVTCNLVP